MANPNHVDVVRQGAKALLAWHMKHPDEDLDLTEADLTNADLVQVDLSAANLRLADLDGANLSKANLNGANLRAAAISGAHLMEATLKEADLSLATLKGADLSYTNLAGANLKKADLSAGRLTLANLTAANLYEANLKKATLTGAMLRAADLSYANLRGANMTEANLHDARLIGANLKGVDARKSNWRGAHLYQALLAKGDWTAARCGGTVFANVDLSGVIGLETVLHSGPSTLGVDSLYLSEARISKRFLRGCGIPEDFVAYLASLAKSPPPFTSCFVSHAYKDEEFVKRLTTRLRQARVRVWSGSEDSQGRKPDEEIDEGLRQFDTWILVLSKNTLRSYWLVTELRKVLKGENGGRIRLLPIKLADDETIERWKCHDAETDADLGDEIRERAMVDFSNWQDPAAFEAAFARFHKELLSSPRAADD